MLTQTHFQTLQDTLTNPSHFHSKIQRKSDGEPVALSLHLENKPPEKHGRLVLSVKDGERLVGHGSYEIMDDSIYIDTMANQAQNDYKGVGRLLEEFAYQLSFEASKLNLGQTTNLSGKVTLSCYPKPYGFHKKQGFQLCDPWIPIHSVPRMKALYRHIKENLRGTPGFSMSLLKKISGQMETALRTQEGADQDTLTSSPLFQPYVAALLSYEPAIWPEGSKSRGRMNGFLEKLSNRQVISSQDFQESLTLMCLDRDTVICQAKERKAVNACRCLICSWQHRLTPRPTAHQHPLPEVSPASN